MKREFGRSSSSPLFWSVSLARKLKGENTIYDSDTNHLWNRLNATLFERTAQDGKRWVITY